MFSCNANALQASNTIGGVHDMVFGGVDPAYYNGSYVNTTQCQFSGHRSVTILRGTTIDNMTRQTNK